MFLMLTYRNLHIRDVHIRDHIHVLRNHRDGLHGDHNHLDDRIHGNRHRNHRNRTALKQRREECWATTIRIQSFKMYSDSYIWTQHPSATLLCLLVVVAEIMVQWSVVGYGSYDDFQYLDHGKLSWGE